MFKKRLLKIIEDIVDLSDCKELNLFVMITIFKLY